MSVHPAWKALVCVVALGATSACRGEANVSPTEVEVRAVTGGVPATLAGAAHRAVLDGSATVVSVAPALVPPGVPLAPFVEARLYAIVQVAMHDALNAIEPRYERYADVGPLSPEAHPAVAVLTAARDAMLGAVPGATATVDVWYANAMAPYTTSDGAAEGIALGHRVAEAILARRAFDGVAGGGFAPYTPGNAPGDYRFTAPFDGPPFNGFADAVAWGTTVTPFVLASTSQFRVPAPYGAPSNALAVQTPRYTRDYNEVKALGCAGCTARTATQTEIARFWVENSPTAWHRLARTVAAQRQLDAWDTARLLALLEMGEFDSYTANLESKYHYNFWRPVTAVANAGADGNAATAPEVGWQVLTFPTPPVPDYPSAHSGAGGTAARIIERLVPGRGPRVVATSTSLPGISRTFDSATEAALENAESRIFVGYHFRLATEAGLAQGREIGDWVTDNALKPLKRAAP